MSTPKRKIEFTPPSFAIRQKVGTGGIKPGLLDKAQKAINENSKEFLPDAKSTLKETIQILEKSKDNPQGLNTEDFMLHIIQLKSSGGMFKYELVTEVADICMKFIEKIEIIEKDAYQVIMAHLRTLQVIISQKITGTGGTQGPALTKELRDMCARYFAKYKTAV